eukprot:UN22629
MTFVVEESYSQPTNTEYQMERCTLDNQFSGNKTMTRNSEVHTFSETFMTEVLKGGCSSLFPYATTHSPSFTSICNAVRRECE